QWRRTSALGEERHGRRDGRGCKEFPWHSHVRSPFHSISNFYYTGAVAAQQMVKWQPAARAAVPTPRQIVAGIRSQSRVSKRDKPRAKTRQPRVAIKAVANERASRVQQFGSPG